MTGLDKAYLFLGAVLVVVVWLAVDSIVFAGLPVAGQLFH